MKRIALATAYADGLRAAPVTVWASGPPIVGFNAEMLEAASTVSVADEIVKRKLTVATLAHQLAKLCSDNVEIAVVAFRCEGGKHSLTTLTLGETTDGGSPRFGGFASDDIHAAEDVFDTDPHKRCVFKNITYKVTRAMSKKLFCDGDYTAFLRQAEALAK